MVAYSRSRAAYAPRRAIRPSSVFFGGVTPKRLFTQLPPTPRAPRRLRPEELFALAHQVNAQPPAARELFRALTNPTPRQRRERTPLLRRRRY